MKAMHVPTVRIERFNEKYLDAFRDLNLQWIRTHFAVEPMDVQQLENPHAILSEGGELFFIVEDGVAVGTCAMVPHGPGSYELAKMAVDPKCRGRG